MIDRQAVIETVIGRSVSEAGEPVGLPVIAFHGTPGSRRQLLIPTAGEIATTPAVRAAHSGAEANTLSRWPSGSSPTRV